MVVQQHTENDKMPQPYCLIERYKDEITQLIACQKNAGFILYVTDRVFFFIFDCLNKSTFATVGGIRACIFS